MFSLRTNGARHSWGNRLTLTENGCKNGGLCYLANTPAVMGWTHCWVFTEVPCKRITKRSVNKPSSPYARRMNTNEPVQLFFHHMVLKLLILL